AAKEATRESLNQELQQKIQKEFREKLPIPPGYGNAQIYKAAQEIAKKLSPQLAQNLTDALSSIPREHPQQIRLKQAQSKTLADLEKEPDSKAGRDFAEEMAGVLEKEEIGKEDINRIAQRHEEFLQKAIAEESQQLHPDTELGELGREIRENIVNKLKKSIENKKRELLIENTLNELIACEPFATLNSENKTRLRQKAKEIISQEIKDTVKTSSISTIALQIKENLIAAEKTTYHPNLIYKQTYQKQELDKQAREQELAEIKERAARLDIAIKTREVEKWISTLRNNPQKAFVYALSPKLTNIFYPSFKPSWLKTLEKASTPRGQRKSIEKSLRDFTKKRILSLPLAEINGHTFSLYKVAKTPSGKELPYLTPISGIVGLVNKARRGLANRIEKWGKQEGRSTLGKDFAQTLSNHLRFRKKNGKKDKSGGLWWVIKGIGKVAATLTIKPLLRGIGKILPTTKASSLLANTWIRLESQGGLLGSTLKTVRVGKALVSATLQGFIKGGLGYGLLGYIISGGNPYITALTAGLGTIGKGVSIYAQTAGAFTWAQLPSLAVPGKTFSLLHFPVIGPVAGGIAGWFFSGGNPQIAVLTTIAGGVADYGIVIGGRVFSQTIWPLLIEKLPALKALGILKYWKAGIIGGLAGGIYASSRGWSTWGVAAAAVGGAFAAMALNWVLLKAAKAIFHSLPVTQIALRTYLLATDWRTIFNPKLLWADIKMLFSGKLFPSLQGLWGIVKRYLVLEGIAGAIKGLFFTSASSFIGKMIAALKSFGGFTILSSVSKIIASTIAKIIASAIVKALLLPIAFAGIVAIFTFSAFQGFTEYRKRHGPQESRYLEIQKTADKRGNIQNGDYLTYTIKASAKDRKVLDAKIRDVIDTSSTVDSPVVDFEEKYYIDTTENHGINVLHNQPQKSVEINEHTQEAPVGAIGIMNYNYTQIDVDLGTLEPHEEWVFVYRVKVDDRYEKEMGAFENNVKLTGKVINEEGKEIKEEANMRLFINAEGREKAVEYAKEYWNKKCHCGYSYSGYGGDCAHFVSHCLAAAGFEQGCGRAWQVNEDVFVSVPRLYNWLIPENGTVVESIEQLEPGDVIIYENLQHAVLYIGNGKIAGHSQRFWGEDYRYRSPYILIHVNYLDER
ncbi:MAG: amidase domain-containing protein, partial [Patescibacteria group bacterium]